MLLFSLITNTHACECSLFAICLWVSYYHHMLQPILLDAIHLFINITKRPRQCIHRISYLDPVQPIRINDTQLYPIVQRSIPTRRHIIHCSRIPNHKQSITIFTLISVIFSSIRKVVLPNPPHPINLCMLQIEEWISHRRKRISAWISTSNEVPGGMNSQKSRSEVSLHSCLESSNMRRLCNEGIIVRILGPELSQGRRKCFCGNSEGCTRDHLAKDLVGRTRELEP